jgi:hypothetical protein
LVEKQTKERPLGKARSKWENNVKVDLKETNWKIHTGFSYDPMSGFCEHVDEPSGYIT